jgi:outer membrane lipoprotein SlyB
MIRSIAGAAVLILTVAMPVQRAAAHDEVGGAIIGAGTGGYIGGMTSGRIEGAFFGAIAGGTAGTIYGSEAEKRRGYSWRKGDCYHHVRGAYVRVTRRLCY